MNLKLYTYKHYKQNCSGKKFKKLDKCNFWLELTCSIVRFRLELRFRGVPWREYRCKTPCWFEFSYDQRFISKPPQITIFGFQIPVSWSVLKVHDVLMISPLIILGYRMMVTSPALQQIKAPCFCRRLLATLPQNDNFLLGPMAASVSFVLRDLRSQSVCLFLELYTTSCSHTIESEWALPW